MSDDTKTKDLIKAIQDEPRGFIAAVIRKDGTGDIFTKGGTIERQGLARILDTAMHNELLSKLKMREKAEE